VFTGFQTTAAGLADDEVLLIIPAKLPFMMWERPKRPLSIRDLP
jgi:hypothetical protein